MSKLNHTFFLLHVRSGLLSEAARSLPERKRADFEETPLW